MGECVAPMEQSPITRIEAPLPPNDASSTREKQYENNLVGESANNNGHNERRNVLSSRSLRSFQSQQNNDNNNNNDDDVDDEFIDGDGNEQRTQDLAAEQERKTLAVRETQNIRYMKIIFVIIMIVSALLSAGGVMLYSYYIQFSTLHEVFESYSVKAFESFNEALESKLGTIDSLSTSITSYALDENLTFPYVTFPNFEVIGSSARVQSESLFIIYVPLVTKEQQPDWEAYAIANHGHLLESYQNEAVLRASQNARFAQEQNDNDVQEEFELDAFLVSQGLGVFNSSIVIDEANVDGPYLPMWQVTPAMPYPGLLNADMTTWEFATLLFPGVVGRAKAILDILFVLDQEGDKGTLNSFLSFGQYRNDAEFFKDDALSTLGYPVFSHFGEDREVVGVLFTALYWRFYLTDILPGSTDSVLCVVENSLNQTAAYLVEGSSVTYLGRDYTVPSRTISFEASRDITRYALDRSGPSTRSYTAVDLDGELITYTLRVYPSNAMYNSYVTSQPFFNGLSVGVVFIVSSLLFVLYNWLVERRQRIIYNKAVKSSAFVSSLYPENIKQRLIENDKRETAAATTGPVQKFLGGSDTANEFSKPIADHFPEATVLFADLPGFPTWTSTREPEQVFILLETLYRSFDAIALRRNVFKVETIGDCYMAVTGVPNPQPDHAILMALFARDCMLKAATVIEDLKDILGADTTELLLRVGLNSGHVTAGVLRSDKARFQLFGDTVNTASRMETKGMKGRIHCSMSTANMLIQGGKGSWVVPREEKIEAKGKGLLQTYWVMIPATKSRKSSMSSNTTSSSSTPPTAHPNQSQTMEPILSGTEQQQQEQEQQQNNITPMLETLSEPAASGDTAGENAGEDAQA